MNLGLNSRRILFTQQFPFISQLQLFVILFVVGEWQISAIVPVSAVAGYVVIRFVGAVEFQSRANIQHKLVPDDFQFVFQFRFFVLLFVVGSLFLIKKNLVNFINALNGRRYNFYLFDVSFLFDVIWIGN